MLFAGKGQRGVESIGVCKRRRGEIKDILAPTARARESAGPKEQAKEQAQAVTHRIAL